jgi:predicted RNA-binding Zn-ribbon protein involved in translation (DUF1610 family)
MTSRTKRTILICTACGEVATIPKDRDHRPLWSKGWRWIGSQNLFSCPNCPPVVIVGADGKHYLPMAAKGPDAEGTASSPGPHPKQGA